MALVKVKPTSPGRRGLVKVVNHDLHKGRPFEKLPESKSAAPAEQQRPHHHAASGGGHKRHYRIVDFRRNKDGIGAKVERLEYDPNRSAHLALLLYADGERRYIVAPRGLAVGSQLMNGSDAPIKAGNCLPLRNIPVGTTVHCVEMLPGKGAQIARSAGASVQLLAREGAYAQLRMHSGEIRKVHVDCRGHRRGRHEGPPAPIGKRLPSRLARQSPTSAACQNPVDHPMAVAPTARWTHHPRSPGARQARVITPLKNSAPTA